ncbi:MAG: hypothetical protein ACFFB3_22585 [Candidatus Hodarchaeota archaeon]
MDVQGIATVVLGLSTSISEIFAPFFAFLLLFREILDELPIIVGVLQIGQYQTPTEGPCEGVNPHSAQLKGFIKLKQPMELFDFEQRLMCKTNEALCL